MDEAHAESIAPPPPHQAPPGPRSPAIHADLNHDEIRSVLARYELGGVHRVHDLRAGSELSPKAVIECDRGKMLLKRRARGLDIPAVVGFAHEVLLGCLRAGLCVPPLVGTKDANNSMVQMHDHVYELFVFIEGTPYARSNAQARASGSLLGEAHRAMDTLETHFEPSIEPTVIDASRAARLAPAEGFGQDRIDRAARILAYGQDLVHANREARAIVHGDWHPGNMIYQGDEIVAACDFDNTRLGSRWRELAQALVHFSMRSGPSIEPDRGLLGAFWGGYQSADDPRIIASLMPAVLVDEALASLGSGAIAGRAGMLSAVLDRAVWMHDHHDQLTAALTH